MQKKIDPVLVGFVILVILILGFGLFGKSDNIETEPKNKFIEDNSGEYIQNNYQQKIETESSGLEELESEF